MFESEIHEGAIGTPMQEQHQSSASATTVIPGALSGRPCAASRETELAITTTPLLTTDTGTPPSPSERFLDRRRNPEPRPSAPPVTDNHNASSDDDPRHTDRLTSAPSENPCAQNQFQPLAAMSDQHVSSGKQPGSESFRSLFDRLRDAIDWD